MKIRNIIFVILLQMATACGAYHHFEPVSPVFLDGVDPKSKIDNLPFDHAWADPQFDGRKYNKCYIAPIRTDLLPADAWQSSASLVITSSDDYKDHAGKIAQYCLAKMVDEIHRYENNRIQVVDKKDSDVINIEIALTELEFSHPLSRAAALAAPIPGLDQAISALSTPHVAFAARLTDQSGKLLMTVADREYPPLRIIDLNELTVSSSAHEVCEIWAETFAEVLNKSRFQKTSRKGIFSILPW